MKNDTPLERLEEWSMPEPNSGCWLWIGALGCFGYGRARWKKKAMGAHRFSWFVHYGAIPDGLCVLHRCDVRCCVNPDHLFLGTHKDNTADMDRKGRRPKDSVQKGSRHPLAKLTDEDVKFILTSPLLGTEVAKKLGVNKVTIYNIRNGHRWKHIRRGE